MPYYESTVITRQEISQADVTKLVESLTETLKELGGKVIKNEYWGLRSLTYRIKKNRKGHYAHLGIDAPVEAIREMERKLQLNEDVIRTLTLKVDAIDKEPSAILQQGSGKDERPSRGRRPSPDR